MVRFEPGFSYTAVRHTTITTTTTVYGPFSGTTPGELLPEENFWTLWCKGRLTEADTPTIRLGATVRTNQCAPPPSPPFFYSPDALPAA